MKYVFLRLLIFAVVSKIHGVATDFMDTLYLQLLFPRKSPINYFLFYAVYME